MTFKFGVIVECSFVFTSNMQLAQNNKSSQNLCIQLYGRKVLSHMVWCSHRLVVPYSPKVCNSLALKSWKVRSLRLKLVSNKLNLVKFFYTTLCSSVFRKVRRDWRVRERLERLDWLIIYFSHNFLFTKNWWDKT